MYLRKNICSLCSKHERSKFSPFALAHAIRMSDGDAIAVLHMHDPVAHAVNSREYCVYFIGKMPIYIAYFRQIIE